MLQSTCGRGYLKGNPLSWHTNLPDVSMYVNMTMTCGQSNPSEKVMDLSSLEKGEALHTSSASPSFKLPVQD
jgi:hypothetical protein